MRVTISFKKENLDENIRKYVLYRSTDKDSLFHADNVVAENTEFSDSDTVEFVDSTIKLSVEYWYGLQTVGKDGASYLTAPKYMCRHANQGAFNKKVIIGDSRAGFCDYDFTALSQIVPKASKYFQEAGLSSRAQLTSQMVSPSRVVYAHCMWRGKDVIYVPSGFVYANTPDSVLGSTIQEINEGFTNRIIPELAKTIHTINGVDYVARLIGVDEYNEMFQFTCTAEAVRSKTSLTKGIFNGETRRGIAPTVLTTSYIVTPNELHVLADSEGKAVVCASANANTNYGDVKVPLVAQRRQNEYYVVPFAFEPVQY